MFFFLLPTHLLPCPLAANVERHFMLLSYHIKSYFFLPLCKTILCLLYKTSSVYNSLDCGNALRKTERNATYHHCRFPLRLFFSAPPLFVPYSLVVFSSCLTTHQVYPNIQSMIRGITWARYLAIVFLRNNPTKYVYVLSYL